MLISSVYAQTAPATATGGDLGSSLMSMLPLVLAKGDEVVTSGGMLGKINQLGDNHIALDVGNGVTIQLQRSAVVQVLPKGSIKSSA
ncbi:MAG: preprotein translocase subunit YajC [Betaproteobacteria bacterium]|nr:preprotein translocase subunit YajC [Betaproteobacteria bacterium]